MIFSSLLSAEKYLNKTVSMKSEYVAKSQYENYKKTTLSSQNKSNEKKEIHITSHTVILLLLFDCKWVFNPVAAVIQYAQQITYTNKYT
jgi:hypothetical protein